MASVLCYRCSPADIFPSAAAVENRTYAYMLTGEIEDLTGNEFAQQAIFDPEIFFNIILPPIIFNAGYSLKRVSV